LSTATALRATFQQVRINLGEVLQLPNWNRSRPWDDYDFELALLEEGFPYIPEPKGWTGPDALTQNFGAYYEVVEHVSHLQFYSICIHVISQIYSAYTYHNSTDKMWAGYVRGSPGLVAAHRYWMRKEGYAAPPHSQDTLSYDGKPHFVEILVVPLRVLTPSFTGFDEDLSSNPPELVGWGSLSDSPSSIGSSDLPPPFTSFANSPEKEIGIKVTTSSITQPDESTFPFNVQTWADASYKPPKVATPTEWPMVDPNFFSLLSGTSLPEPDSTLTLHSGELQRFSQYPTSFGLYALIRYNHLEELGW
jgi:hypothetical protein